MTKRLLDKLPELMRDEEFAQIWNETSEEFAIAREIIKARTRAGLSQKELAEQIKTTQSVIARLESGVHIPSVSTLKRVARATHCQLRVEFVQ